MSWIDAKKELPKKSIGSYSESDVFVCRMYTYCMARTFNDKWVDMKNQPLNDVILWMQIPKIEEIHHKLFND